MWTLLVSVFTVALASSVPVPDDCVSSPNGDSGGISLFCTLSAINSADEKTDFAVIPSSHTTALTVRCRDSVLSRLDPDGFRSLVHLRKLTLDGCSLREIPARAFWGLKNLRSLTVRTREGSGVLKVDSDAFLGLGQLEELDLSANHVRYLSPNALCPVGPSLRTLNVSRNELTSLSDLGRGSLACLRSIRSVDVSHNRLAIISADQMAAWNGLEELRVNDNEIKSIKGNAFKACSRSLKFVDLSNNDLSVLPDNLLAETVSLRRIGLANNSLTELPSVLFKSQSRSLEVLDLSGNRLRSLAAPLLANLPRLSSLDLSRNQLESVESPAALRGLTSLRSLKLGHNRLGRLPNFPALPSLRYLVLSDNALAKLNNRLLYRVPALSHLLLDANRLEELPERLFANTTGLTVLDLSNNRLSEEIPRAVNALKNLQSFAIGDNRIDNLSELRLPALWRLQASGNRLKNISAVQLKGLPALQVLDLSRNRIASIEKAAFAGNRPLQAIRLDGNRLERLDGLFHDLPNLSWLNMSDNQVSIFDYAMVPKTLTWLDIHQNNLTSLENYFSLEAVSQLTHVDASFNQLKELGPQNVPNSVETLLLNDNHISTVVPYTFFKKSKLRKVDLSVNRLESIDRNALRLTSDEAMSSPPKFYLGGNPIRCDCHMAWFKGINSLQIDVVSETSGGGQNYPVVDDLESIYCELLYSRGRSFVPLVDAPADDFLCAYKTHCFALCHCCDYDACDCEMTCPNNCTCYHDTTWTKNIAECTGAGFHDLPDQLPMDSTEIFLDGNNIGELHSHTFIGRKNLRVLYLNNSLISSVDNHTFNGLAALEQLHLEGNSITKMQGDEFHGLTLLRELYLHDNVIRTVNNATFRDLRSLEILSLHNNRLVDFPAWQFSLNPSLRKLSLSGNEWSCRCGFVKALKDWLLSQGRSRLQVMDASEVSCHDGGLVISLSSANATSSCVETAKATTHVMIRDGEQSVVSGGIDNTGVSSGGFMHDFLPIVLGVISVVVLAAVLVVLIFIYRDEMRIWLYSKYGVRFFHRVDGNGAGGAYFDDADKLFDAFVTYSAKDDAFVRQMLAPELEMAPPEMQLNRGIGLHSSQYKLCLFYRDLPPVRGGGNGSDGYVGGGNAGDAIVQAAEASRRTILVLSEHFIKLEWSKFEFKSGLQQAFRTAAMSRSGSRRRSKRLIVIALGDVAQRRDLDPDLRLVLKSSVLLQWNDKKFWEKLRYALPDVDKFVGGRCNGVSPSTLMHHSSTMMTSAFSPDDSFRYETYRHQNGHGHGHGGGHHTLNLNGNHYQAPLGHFSQTMQHPRLIPPPPPSGPPPPQPIYHAPSSNTGGSSTYQSISTPDEQDSSTRTMTIHI